MQIKIEYQKREFNVLAYKRTILLKELLGTFDRIKHIPYDFTSYYASYKRELNGVDFHSKKVTFYHKKTNLIKSYYYNTLSELKQFKTYFKESIQAQRCANRQLKERTGYFGPKIGKVYNQSGLVLKRVQEKILKAYKNNKVPNSKDNHIGVEIECFGPVLDWTDLAFAFNNVNPSLVNHVCISSDGSIRPDSGTSGYEIKVVAPQNEIASIINQVTSVLNALNFKVNSSCGLHVHLDMRSRDAKKAYHNLVSMQSLLLKLQPKSRRTNTYCRRNINKNLNSRFDNQKYKAINKRRMWDLNTLEVRLHSGSLNSNKINSWIDLLIKIVDNDQLNIPRMPSKVEKIGALLKLDNSMISYIKTRIEDVALAS